MKSKVATFNRGVLHQSKKHFCLFFYLFFSRFPCLLPSDSHASLIFLGELHSKPETLEAIYSKIYKTGWFHNLCGDCHHVKRELRAIFRQIEMLSPLSGWNLILQRGKFFISIFATLALKFKPNWNCWSGKQRKSLKSWEIFLQTWIIYFFFAVLKKKLLRLHRENQQTTSWSENFADPMFYRRLYLLYVISFR